MPHETNQLSLNLLGSFQCRVNGQDRSEYFRTKKERALLAYLMVEREHAHPRELLGEMFWPEKPEDYARTNLRQAISGIRRAIQNQDNEPPFLLITDETVRANPASNIKVDCMEFDRIFEQTAAHRHGSIDSCSSCLQALSKIVDLYQGDFLGEHLPMNTQDFQEWVLFRREHHLRRLLAIMRIFIQYYEEIGEIKKALEYAYMIASRAHLEESAHRQLMRLLALDGRRSAAMEQYQACCRILSEELGVPPDLETTALYEKIKAGLIHNVFRPILRPKSTNLPVQFAKFVGREEEMNWADETMREPLTRLLTVTGISGVGKTRFSIQLAAKLMHFFPDGIWFVPLNAIHAVDLIPHEIARILKINLGESDPRWVLVNYLQDKDLLLVIDNFEHLLDGTILLLDILRETPGVKMIVTSQRRLSYQSVQTLELSGLPYPKEYETDWRTYPAVELFLDRAKRSQADYHVIDKDIPHLIQICQFVDGLPLGLELAAAGLRFFSCQNISQELAQNLDLLATTMKDIPERHRSLRAAFNHSWNILPELEKDAFRRLSIYQGEFSLDDGMATTGASIGVISRLVDRSLIQKNSSGFYLIQPVLRQYAVEKLEELYAPDTLEEDLYYFSSEDLSITRDPLTQLPNRVLFRDLFKQTLAIGRRRGKYVALMIVELENIHTLKRDLDPEKLKPLIKQAAEVLVRTVRDSDIVACLAPGKFAVILESISQPQDGSVVAQKIRSGFDQAYILLPDGSKSNMHIGISVYPQDGEDISELLNNANWAMNKAKLESINYHYNAYDKPAFLSFEK